MCYCRMTCCSQFSVTMCISFTACCHVTRLLFASRRPHQLIRVHSTCYCYAISYVVLSCWMHFSSRNKVILMSYVKTSSVCTIIILRTWLYLIMRLCYTLHFICQSLHLPVPCGVSTEVLWSQKVQMWCSSLCNKHISQCHFEFKRSKQEAQLMLTNPRDSFRGQSRSTNIAPFHMLDIVSYQCTVVTLSLIRAVFQIFDFKNVVTLKSGSEVIQAH